MGYYKIAQICKNGHLLTSSVSPEIMKKFCTTCGEATLTRCESCNSTIKGNYHVEGFVGMDEEFTFPSYCDNCGIPYPWTLKLHGAAMELVQLSTDLSISEKEEMSKSIGELMSDSPQTKVAGIKYKSYVAKMRKELGVALKDVLVDIVSETAKKAIWGP